MPERSLGSKRLVLASRSGDWAAVGGLWLTYVAEHRAGCSRHARTWRIRRKEALGSGTDYARIFKVAAKDVRMNGTLIDGDAPPIEWQVAFDRSPKVARAPSNQVIRRAFRAHHGR
jgi:hypothetical protein